MSTKTAKLPSVSETMIVGPVAERLLVHLGDETTTLAAMLSAVRGVHTALRQLDDEALRQSIEAETRELSSSIAVQQRRHELQDQLAKMLDVVPQDITLRRLIAVTSGSLRDAIERGWRSLSEMAAEMERLNRQNAAMIGQSMSIARGVVERLTGASAVGESYGADGARTLTHVGPLIQWGG